MLFNTPVWWSILKKSETSIQFHRADTRYDWHAKCELFSDQVLDLEKFTITKLEQENILFDQECTDISFHGENLRIEGTATRDNEQRLYLDIYVVRNNSNDIYYFESRSSILNGCVEGPYFEELIKSIRKETSKAAEWE